MCITQNSGSANSNSSSNSNSTLIRLQEVTFPIGNVSIQCVYDNAFE